MWILKLSKLADFEHCRSFHPRPGINFLFIHTALDHNCLRAWEWRRVTLCNPHKWVYCGQRGLHTWRIHLPRDGRRVPRYSSLSYVQTSESHPVPQWPLPTENNETVLQKVKGGEGHPFCPPFTACLTFSLWLEWPHGPSESWGQHCS